MKKLKKLFLLLIVGTTLVTLTGCGEKNVEGTLEEIMEKLNTNIPEDKRPMGLMNTEVTDENIEWYLGQGTKDIEYEEAIASESATGSIAHSVVLVRMKDNANIEKTKETILEKVDPRKWICVGVEREDVIVKSKGNLIIVIIVEDETTREKLEEGFDNL